MFGRKVSESFNYCAAVFICDPNQFWIMGMKQSNAASPTHFKFMLKSNFFKKFKSKPSVSTSTQKQKDLGQHL